MHGKWGKKGGSTNKLVADGATLIEDNNFDVGPFVRYVSLS
jgi:hypothetical protein